MQQEKEEGRSVVTGDWMHGKIFYPFCLFVVLVLSLKKK